MTLRVAHVLNSPGHGGVPRVAEALVRHADRSRVTPHVFFLKDGEGPDLFAPLDCPNGRATGAGGKTGATAELADWLAARRIDILHCHSFRPNLYARMAGALLRPSGLRIVAHYHNDYSDKWADPQALSLERRLSAVTDARIAVSSSVAAHVAAAVGCGPEAIEVVPNALDRGRLAGADRGRGRRALGLGPGEIAVGLVGRVCHQKGVDTFVQAVLGLLDVSPDLSAVVIGEVEDSALRDRLDRQIAAQGAEHRIRFSGHRQDIGDMLAALDLLAAPSRWEGFGLALVEAMGMGLPVVATHVGAIPEVTAGAAALVAPDDPAALAAQIAALCASPARRATMAEVGRAVAARFDWPASAARVMDIYERLPCPR